MKITVVSHDSFWPLRGGGGLRVYWIVKQLVKLGHDVTVLAPFLSMEGTKEEFPNVKLINLGNVSRFQKKKEKKYLLLGYRILKKLWGLKSDVIYAHNVVSAFPSLIVSKLKRISLVYDIDDFTMGLSSKKFIQDYGPLLECFTARHADKVVSMSASLKEELEKRNVRNISCVSHGVDFKIFNPLGKKKEDLVVYMGGIEKHDGAPLIPLAAKKVIKSFPQTKFLLIGKGADLPAVQGSVKRLGLEDNFIFKDWVNHQEIPSYLEKARLGLVTHYKNLATDIALVLKGFEYMAMALPVVAPDLRGMIEEIGNNERGLIFKCADADDLAEKIITLLGDEELQIKLGTAGRKFVLDNCDWDKNALQIAEICIATAKKPVK